MDMAIGAKPRASRLVTVIAANIGAALEWYDLVLYALFAVVLGRQFFPAVDPATSTLLSLGAFAIAWVVRPLGAALIGAYSDRVGRKPGLTLSAALMMVGTLLIAVLPPFSVIGVAAPLLLVLARMIQGFSAGGEFGSATALLAEQDPTRRGFYASLQWAASGFAVFLASVFAYAVNALADRRTRWRAWGWRVPFLFGLLIGPAALYIRTRPGRTGGVPACRPDRHAAAGGGVATTRAASWPAPGWWPPAPAAATSTPTCRSSPSPGSVCRPRPRCWERSRPGW